MTVCRIDRNDMISIQKALDIAESVFMEIIAPSYPPNGAESFVKLIRSDDLKNRISSGSIPIWTAFNDSDMIGMMALRDDSHICFAFVKTEAGRKGAGKAMFEAVRQYVKENGCGRITVNASQSGKPFYTSLGFADDDMETIKDGIIYTPMSIEI